jgi:hypothetical protein
MFRSCRALVDHETAAVSRQRTSHPAPQGCVDAWNSHPPNDNEMSIIGAIAAQTRIPHGRQPAAIHVYVAGQDPDDSARCVVVISQGTPLVVRLSECEGQGTFEDCTSQGPKPVTPANATTDGSGHLCWGFVQITVFDSCAGGTPRKLPHGQKGS